jgi:hypothetical protein
MPKCKDCQRYLFNNKCNGFTDIHGIRITVYKNTKACHAFKKIINK